MEEPTLNAIVLESVQNDVAQVGEALKAVAAKVVEEGISEYPVFVAAHEIIEIGRPVFDRDSVQLNWFFHVTILEDFISREIVKRDRVKAFQDTYGDPLKTACIFVLTPEQGQFIFVPYDVDAIEPTKQEASE